MAFIDQFQDNFTALQWPDGLELNPNREFVFKITGLGDLTGATFECQVRSDSTSSTALIDATVTTSTDDGGTLLINIDDEVTKNLKDQGSRLYVALDAIIGGDRYAFYAGYLHSNPFGTGLPTDVTEVVFEDMLAQLEAQVALAEAAATAAETAQAAAESAAENATGIGDGDKGDITVSGSGSVWTVNSGAVDYSDVANTPTIPTNNNELTNGAGYITGYTVTEGDVTAHESALSLTKSQISDLNEADYATAAQGALADSALQSGDNISSLTNDSGFITGYTVTEGDVTGVLSGATLTDAGTPASDDKILIQDTSDTNSLKYVSFDEFGGGGVDWSQTQSSPVVDGASATAFNLLADNTINLGKLFQVSDGSSTYYLKGGKLNIIEPGFSNAIIGVNNSHKVGIQLSYNNRRLVWVGDEATTINSDDDVVGLGYYGLRFVTGYDATIGYNPVADSDESTTLLTLQGQSAFPGATTNQDGEGIWLRAGKHATGGGDDGPIQIESTDAAVPDATLKTSSLAFFIDEASDKLIVKAKYSDGTTVKTFEIAANP